MIRKVALSIEGILFLGVLFTMSGCNLSNDNAASLTVPPSAATAFFHASPDASGMDIFMNGQKLNASFTYKTYTPYLQLVPVGSWKVKFTSVANSATLIDTSFIYVDSKIYSVAVINKTAAPNSPKQALLIEDKGTAPTNGNTLIRFIHLSPDTPPVDVNFVDAGASLVTGHSYKEASAFKEFAQRSYNVEIRRSSDNVLLLALTLPAPVGTNFQTICFTGYSTPPAGNNNTLTTKIVN